MDIGATVTPSEVTKGYDFQAEKRQARNFLANLGFGWEGGEEGGFANIETFKWKLELYLKSEEDGLQVGAEYIEQQVNKALKLANNCFDKLGLKEKIDDPDEEGVYLPYHGKTHARNTLFNGMGAWLVKVQKLVKEYELDEEQQKKWVAIGARVLAMHEIDDWWEPTSLVTDEVKVGVRRMIINDLVGEGIDAEDFDDFIRLDNFMEPVTAMLEAVQKERKEFLIPNSEAKKEQGEREVNKHPFLVEALGDVVVGADFMQVLNPNYQKEIPVLADGEEMKIMTGPLALALEMYMVMPQRILKNWQKLAGYLWTLDYKKIGVDRVFLEKIKEKTVKHWEDLGEFNEEELRNARKQFQALEEWVKNNENGNKN